MQKCAEMATNFLQEKEFYRGSILGMLENLDLEKLAYIYVIVSDVVNEN